MAIKHLGQMPPGSMRKRRRSSSDLSSDEPDEFKHLVKFDCARPPYPFPSPAKIRAMPSRCDSRGSNTRKFHSLNIIVKYGERVTTSEAHCLRALRRLVPNEVPVPEVYGWCEDKGQVFIYMELIDGVTLESQWDLLSDQAKQEACNQLRTAVGTMRRLRQDPDCFIGRIDRKPLLDIIFTDSKKSTCGPFKTVRGFHNWISALVKRGRHGEDPSQVLDPVRGFLPDKSRIFFTHGDLRPSNILVSTDGSGRILSIIDWHQSGWYPEYWEFCKALYSSDYDGDWATKYVPQIADVAECYESWAWYPYALGC